VIEWTIKSIKHWEDDTWDALLCVSRRNGWSGYDRVISTDGFNWRGKRGEVVEDRVQQMLTEAVGDMVTHGIRVVVF
jgi:hypothetical protein